MRRYSQSLEKVICSFQGEMLPGKMCFVILRQIVYALKFVHKHGYIHGDIKGANIMVNEVNLEQVYLVDFGLARRYMINDKHIEDISRPVSSYGCLGTIQYASRDAHNSYSKINLFKMKIIKS